MKSSSRCRPRISLRAAAGSLAAVLGAGVLAACSSTASGTGEDGKLRVTSAFYPLTYLAEEIGGSHVDVDTLTKPGQEPHDLEISAKQTVAIEDSGVLLYLKGLQPSVDDVVAQSSVKHKLDAASLTTLEKHGTEVGGHAEEHDHGGEAGEDPHVWLDPVRYAQLAKGVGKELEKADPDHADTYAKNTKTLVGKLGELDTDYREGLRNTRTKVFLTTHAAFGYLAERYGLTEEAIAGLNPESEPSLSRMKDLREIAKADHVTTVFYETLVSDRTAKTVAGDSGLRTDVLDPLEGITDKSRGDDYIEVMRANLTALQKALGAS
ncbi:MULTISPECIES: metal ABC transporter substrate-binding protein [Streptomyces]|uniref:Metal ABC transporter substrate-binding protein n=1 Tax=Streptomyces evansiae TaxID=3075535 RepID=A0ABU2R7A3_9ACTN|nr:MULTISPECIES: metal ABC transporter substrate-binding protein [unclassified Streptomyces]MDT0411150.1 metal ABC transporter substrate-binding protein [Streptomyces sp. DSM 41979]MYQ59333.1 zinc ABC transporter solute-binding protein [Streptomyces sp. SID4926]